MTDQDILREALERFQSGLDGDYDNRERDDKDRRFYRGGTNQWDAQALELRKNRPTVTINRLPQFVKQVTGEMRQNRPSIRVLPVDDQSDPKLAEVYTAIIRHIESLSDAHRVYSKAGEQSVIGGIGWFRVLTDWLDDKSFAQEIKVKSIRNPLSVVIDPDASELTRHDMKWAFVSELISEEKFRKEYPDANNTGWPDDDTHAEWKRGEFIRIAEYWTREPYQRDLYLMSDGSTRYGDDQVDPGLLAPFAVVGSRKVTAHKVKCRKMTGLEILEVKEWPGAYIPLVPAVGEEVEAGDDVFRHGLIHHARDSQKSYNFARSAMLEHTASQPKAPYLATTAMVKNHQRQWENLNVDNPPVLLYDADPTVAGGRPVREAPPTFPAAWYQEAQVADNDMKAATGIYDASLGAKGNETSGVAINARDRQGETATYVYLDNLTAAIHHCGRILIELIPHIYTGERVIRMMGEDGAIESYAQINSRMPDGTLFNDISVGQFDLVVDTGPAFSTKRQEAQAFMQELMRSSPQLAQAMPDWLVKISDMPYSQKIIDRLIMMFIPPGVDAEVEKRRMEIQQELQQVMPQQQGPSPQEQAQMQSMMLQLEKLSAEIEKIRSETAENYADIELNAAEARLGAFDAGHRIGAG